MSISSTFTDLATDTLYVVDDDEVLPWFSGDNELTGTWRSKVIVRNDQPGFGWLRVNADDLTAGVIVRIYGDGALHYTSPSLTSREPVRMPSGRYREWEIEVESTARVNDVVLASSAAELEAV